jgi:transposase
MPVLRGAHQGRRAGRGVRAGAVRAAGRGAGRLLWHGQFLSRDRACAALGEMFGCAPSAGALAAQARKIAGLISPALAAIIGALAGAEVAHFDETGFRVAGKLAWVQSASAGKFVLVTVHSKRGKEGMDAAGVLPAFAGIACHDAWKPYDGYDGVAGHALCGAHLLRELIAVTETGTEDDVIWAQQAIDALLTLNEAADAAREAGGVIDPEIVDKQSRWFREAADAGIVLNAARRGKLRKKRRALAARMRDRADDYLRFARDLRVPFDNSEAERVIRMSKHQGLRLHALHVRCGDLLRHPLLPRDRRPPRHRRSRRPHPRRPG